MTTRKQIIDQLINKRHVQEGLDRTCSCKDAYDILKAIAIHISIRFHNFPHDPFVAAVEPISLILALLEKCEIHRGVMNLRADVSREREYQDEKWGKCNLNGNWSIRFAVLLEEMGELSQAILKNDFEDGDEHNILKEAVQVMALLVQFIEWSEKE